MALIQVLEHQRIAISDRRTEGVEPTMTPHQAAMLERVEETLPSKALEWGQGSVKFAQFCGVIAIGDDTIEILPKIYGREGGIGESRDLLVQMLFVARRMKLHPGSSASIRLQKHHLLDVFIRQFCDELFFQLRQGMIRRYVDCEDDLRVLRGKLNMTRQVRSNAVHRELLSCEYDELLENNEYNQIIKRVLVRLLAISTAPSTKRNLTELSLRFDSVDDRVVSAEEVDDLLLDRTMVRYRTVFEYCRWFLNGMHPDVVSGGNPYLALLFDMNRLFEEFVAAKLKRAAWTHGLRVRVQGPQRYFAMRSGSEVFLMKPDIVLFDESERLVGIVDTKWKVIDEEERKLGVSQSDLYQMVGYAQRYGCLKVFLVYPKTEFVTRSHRFDVLPNGPEVHVVPVDLLALAGSGASDQWRDLFAAVAADRPRAPR